MKVGIYAKSISSGFTPNLLVLFKTLSNLKAHIWIHPQLMAVLKKSDNLPALNNLFILKNSDVPDNLDFLITIGGDGTFLGGLSAIKLKNIPLLGINTGRLGFLADISPNEIEATLISISKQEYKIEHRSILQAQLNPLQNIAFPYAINDLTVHKRDTSSMIVIHAYIDDVFLANYWADGLIISTPTGSTAYSMSAGGPIVSPDSNSLIITPIASHNLTVRPLVIPDHHKISLKIESRDSKFLLSLDSRSFVIEETLEVQVKTTKNKVSLIKLNNHSYYSTLRNKLMWGVDNRN
ncbi:MAG: NAD kinase [Salinivirgaceae bacterium]|nr:NAD kinase [Salinivirgaceae bacterium]